MADPNPAISKTIHREGDDKITDDPTDPGGLTKYGISKRYHPYIDIRNLTRPDAVAIYKREYWDSLRGDEIHSQAVAEILFDAGVNPGVDTALKIARLILGLSPAGGADDEFIQHLNDADPVMFSTAFILAKIARYSYLVEKDRTKEKYFWGWVRRALKGVE